MMEDSLNFLSGNRYYGNFLTFTKTVNINTAILYVTRIGHHNGLFHWYEFFTESHYQYSATLNINYGKLKYRTEKRI